MRWGSCCRSRKCWRVRRTSATRSLRWFIGVLLLVGAVLYALPRSAVLGAIYLTAFLGGAVAAHVRIGSPLFTHILFGVYVAVLMWAGLVLRRPALLGMLLGRR
jgi:hypothetical protein